MEQELFAKMSEVLFINMFGEGSRDNNIINISNFNYKEVESKICLKIALSVASLYNYKVGIDCGKLEFWKVLWENKLLFRKKRRLIRNKESIGRSAKVWLLDISKAFEKDIAIWERIWEYLNGK